jgi:hypothetical protein
LQSKLAVREREEQLDRVEVSKLLQDYLDLYKKALKTNVPARRSEKKDRRSRSRGGVPQTDRKGRFGHEERREDTHTKNTLERMERDLGRLQQEVEQLRMSLVEKDALLRAYRGKERKHLLAGG